MEKLFEQKFSYFKWVFLKFKSSQSWTNMSLLMIHIIWTFGSTVEIQLHLVHIEGCYYQIFYIISVPQAI